jgi:hypothetical protein
MTLPVRRTAQRQNHVSSKPFQHIAVALLCQPGRHTAFTQGFPQLSGAECSRCSPRWGSTRGQNLPQKEPLERRQQHATFESGRKRLASCEAITTNCGHTPSRKSENLSKDQFGVLAKGTLRKLYFRIEAPWPELIEGVCLLTYLMPDERRELHKSPSKPHICSRFIVYTKPPAGSARGLAKKVNRGDSAGNWGGLG